MAEGSTTPEGVNYTYNLCIVGLAQNRRNIGDKQQWILHDLEALSKTRAAKTGVFMNSRFLHMCLNGHFPLEFSIDFC